MSFDNRFCLAEATVAASIPYYESNPTLSRRVDITDIILENYLLITYETYHTLKPNRGTSVDRLPKGK
jgi:hypothetical protein